jgi:hypothetical protein
VHLKGAIATTTSNFNPFTLPVSDRPAHTVFVVVDMADAITGRLQITSNGEVLVEPEAGDDTAAKTLTSLEGMSFVQP